MTNDAGNPTIRHRLAEVREVEARLELALCQRDALVSPSPEEWKKAELRVADLASERDALRAKHFDALAKEYEACCADRVLYHTAFHDADRSLSIIEGQLETLREEIWEVIGEHNSETCGPLWHDVRLAVKRLLKERAAFQTERDEAKLRVSLLEKELHGYGTSRADRRKRAMRKPVPWDPPCPGDGKCHGAQVWCDACGDVDAVCHASAGACDIHWCPKCSKPIKKGGHTQGSAVTDICRACWEQQQEDEAVKARVREARAQENEQSE